MKIDLTDAACLFFGRNHTQIWLYLRNQYELPGYRALDKQVRKITMLLPYSEKKKHVRENEFLFEFENAKIEKKIHEFFSYPMFEQHKPLDE